MFEDRLLIAKAQQGDWTAFERIYQKYLDCLLTIAVNLLGNAQEAEDVVQDIFTKLIEALDDFRLRGSLKGFLATCVANRCRDRLRSHKRHARHHNQIKAHKNEESVATWHHADGREQVTHLQQALGKLPVEQREMIVLKTHSGQSFRSLARQLNLPLGTVQGRYRSGMEKLQRLLPGDEAQ